MTAFNRLVFIGGLLLLPAFSFGQYILNGSATKESCNCYVLTTENKSLIGSVWQATKIDLTKPFDYFFDVYLGCKDVEGADGIVFILQPNSTSIGSFGEGLGFHGISPSVGISLDTYQNADDPSYDHISIQLNGDILHKNDLAGPVPASTSNNNIEDCKWHILRIVWDPATDSLSTYFDGQWRLGTRIDLVKNVFKDDPMVYWGFSGATGGMVNVQKFCTSVNSEFETNSVRNEFCLGTPIQFKNNATGSVGISNYLWDFGDGNTSTIANPMHDYSVIGEYTVKFQFTSNDGCESKVFSNTLIVGDIPKATMVVSDTCESLNPTITTKAVTLIGQINQWEWNLNNQPFSTEKNPNLSTLLPGNYTLSYRASSEYGCISDPAQDDFTILPKPAISFSSNDACVGEVIRFKGLKMDDQAVSKWQWQFDNEMQNGQEAQYSFGSKGTYPVTLTATGMNGCSSIFEKSLFINFPVANAGQDTIVLPNTPFQLNASGGNTYSWTPSLGLNNISVYNPVGKIENDIRYTVQVTTIEGCTDTASLKVTVFKGSAIYVPNAFTPNNDGLNDVLKPYFIGIKSLSFFTIHDRWGKKLFSTNSLTAGWNGVSGGKIMESGTYVWVLRAVDIIGKIYDLNGTFTILK